MSYSTAALYLPSCQVVPNTHADLSHLSTASGTAVPTANGNCAEGMASPSHESNCSSSKQHNSKNSVAAAVVVAGIASAEVGCQPQHQQQHTSSSSSSIAAANNGFQHQPKLLRVQDHVYGILRCDWSFFFIELTTFGRIHTIQRPPFNSTGEN